MSKLFNCKDCNKEISSSAKACPNCGWRVKVEDIPFLKMTFPQRIQVVLTSLFALLIIYIFLNVAFFSEDEKVPKFDHALKEEMVSYFKSDEEPTVKDAVWLSDDTFGIAVLDDGTNRKGFAMYVCQELKNRGFDSSKGLYVKIIDILKLVNENEWKSLGFADCETYRAL